MAPEICGSSTEQGEKAQTLAMMTPVSASKETDTRSVSHRSFSITPVPPFRLDLTAWALRRRPENAIDRWDGTTYQRVLMIDRQAVDVAVHQCGGPEKPHLEVELTGSRITVQQEDFARTSLERMLGVHRDLDPFYRLAKRDPRLQLLADEFRGLKPPQFYTMFEAVANGIACQQLSLLVGILLLSRLAHAVGKMSANSQDASHAFPDPVDFREVTAQSLKVLGFSTNKSQALLDVSSGVRDRGLDLESLVHFDNQSALEQLVKLKGVGRWTAEYVLLRGLGRLDIFPGDDVGARKKLAHFLGKRKPLDYDGVRRAVADWQPYAGFVYFHLLLARIKKAGWLCSDRALRESQDLSTGPDRDWKTAQSQEKTAIVTRHLMNFKEEEKT
jgi:DNA-3-methyladenine glycosylase II